MYEANYTLKKKLEVLETENNMLRKKMHFPFNIQDLTTYTVPR
jgi:hypothetical protein